MSYSVFRDLPHSQSQALSLNTQAAEDYLQHHYQPLHVIQEDEQGERPLTESPNDDTFEQILEATSHQDAVIAYYYLDSNNQVSMRILALRLFHLFILELVHAKYFDIFPGEGEGDL